nr:restriction endonuclease [Deltaproteobacteria bacterium]
MSDDTNETDEGKEEDYEEDGSDDDLFGRAEAKEAIRALLEDAKLDGHTGEVVLTGPWGAKYEPVERRFSSLDDLIANCRASLTQRSAPICPMTEGNPFFEVDGDDIVQDAISQTEIEEFFERAAQEEDEEEEAPPDGKEAYRTAVRLLCETFAKKIAEDPDFLNHIEWRELEKTLAEVFEKIGFKVTLTPSSKDGGKDVILETSFKGQKSVYFVEVKHWRSGKQVGTATMRDFVSVVLKEKVTSGIFVSSSGYVEGAYKALTVTERRKLVLQGREKVYTLCKTYALALSGLWQAPDDLADIVLK